MVPIMRNMYILRLSAGQLREPYGDVEITVTEARSKLPELIDTQIRDGGVVYLTRYGRRVGVVVPVAMVLGVTAAAAGPPPKPRRPLFADASPAQVRSALIPEEAAEFDHQWCEVMTRATETLDLTEVLAVLAVLESWRRVAWLAMVNGPDAHRRMYRRAAAHRADEDIPDDEPLPRTKARLGL
jgi:antitoxin (DNA-binding transcriptional repressor) of toxin-antitoxin stability system